MFYFLVLSFKLLFLLLLLTGFQYKTVKKKFSSLSYIGWREQNYPGFNKDTNSLLQNCIKYFMDMKEFHQNEKYIQLWIKMVSFYRAVVLGL